MKALNIYERKTYTNRKTLLKYRKKNKNQLKAFEMDIVVTVSE